MSCRAGDIVVYPRSGLLPSVNPMNTLTQDTTTVPVTDPSGTSAHRGASAGHRALVVAGAAAAALLAWLVAGPLLGVNLEVLQTPGAATAVTVTGGSVAVSALAAGLLGWAALAVLERVSSRRGPTVWRWIAATVTLGSLTGPLTLAQGTGGTVVLTLLHLIVAGVLLTALPAQRSD